MPYFVRVDNLDVAVTPEAPQRARKALDEHESLSTQIDVFQPLAASHVWENEWSWAFVDSEQKCLQVRHAMMQLRIAEDVWMGYIAPGKSLQRR